MFLPTAALEQEGAPSAGFTFVAQFSVALASKSLPATSVFICQYFLLAQCQTHALPPQAVGPSQTPRRDRALLWLPNSYYKLPVLRTLLPPVLTSWRNQQEGVCLLTPQLTQR